MRFTATKYRHQISINDFQIIIFRTKKQHIANEIEAIWLNFMVFLEPVRVLMHVSTHSIHQLRLLPLLRHRRRRRGCCCRPFHRILHTPRASHLPCFLHLHRIPRLPHLLICTAKLLVTSEYIACFAYAPHTRSYILCIAPFIVTTVSFHIRFDTVVKIVCTTTIELSVNKLWGTKQCNVNVHNNTEREKKKKKKQEWEWKPATVMNMIDLQSNLLCSSRYVDCHFIRWSKVIFGICSYILLVQVRFFCKILNRIGFFLQIWVFC